ncbi:Nin one binding Zn-ribbon like-domain-containing protein [Histomonas meleagridis]|uniref:Nin one binding Zn-ribbon like-domain-containing protein n=1 Tax=Histomonas meleagridis TaxID=135588 RepID=UPI00355A9EFD|nr:Nin one binding Zn-ribbon like-domain-containing protein [Histomonas meleagridis]KAH0801443.1 Nin one binding Zn-ribbon like-domain-containing protein [Histomonas meleagridis]
MDDNQTIFIADANFFIEGNTTIQAPQKIYTTQDALNEVRDQRSRENLERIKVSHDIIIREPSKESYNAVVECATESGNINLLSQTDMRLIALSLDMQPPDKTEEDTSFNNGFDQWITVDNFGKINDTAHVILCTGDATMQCIAVVMGIHVVSPTGQRIAEVKRWLMRCSACGAETLDATKEFCPECGQHELVRYALVTRADGDHELPLPKRFEPTTRGKKYSIPTNRGGKHQKPRLVLSEDMLMEARRKYAWTGGARSLKKNAPDGHTFFEPRKKSRPPPEYGFGKANPNVPHHLLGKKRKRNQ